MPSYKIMKHADARCDVTVLDKWQRPYGRCEKGARHRLIGPGDAIGVCGIHRRAILHRKWMGYFDDPATKESA
jgi:hypothetical protein